MLMMLVALFIALFSWWFSTGIILLAVRRADRAGGDAHMMSLIMASPLLVLGIVLAFFSLDDALITGAYGGFFGALLIWGWIELAFLTGLITGPSKQPCPPGIHGWRRLSLAWSTICHHELALLWGLLLLLWLSQDAANHVALATYGVLFVARISAKVNLFLGVPKINMQFVPSRMLHMASYFRRASVGFVFALSITCLTAVFVLLVYALFGAQTDGAKVTHVLLASLMGLALLEHWLMVLPLPDAKLWQWMLPAPLANYKKQGEQHGL